MNITMKSLLSKVVHAMEKIAPLSLAETSWDNVGVLLEAPFPKRNANKVFLTIDLTWPVLEECLSDPNVGVIVSYHPPLFKSFKRLTMNDEKQKIALTCAASGISIYSPHTSLDNCADGINDWLASGLGKGITVPITPFNREDCPGAGSGRLHTLDKAIPCDEMILRIKRHLGLNHVRFAQSQSKIGQENLIQSVAICAGSGSSVLRNVQADLYLTGEMSHHDVLAAVSSNINVVLCEHTNTERGYLRTKLKPKLETLLNSMDTAQSKSSDDKIQVVLSSLDKDPLTVV